MDSVFIVLQNDKYLDVNSVKVFNTYERAREYFLSQIGEWMLLYIADHNLNMEVEKTGLWDADGEAIDEVPEDYWSFEKHGCEINCYVNEDTNVMMKEVKVVEEC